MKTIAKNCFPLLRLCISLIFCTPTLVLIASDAKAQQPSVSGTYCGTWASGNYWRVTLRQKGTDVSASLTGRTRDGRPFTGSGSGNVSGSQVSVPITFVFQGRPGASGGFSGTLSGKSISATFSRGAGDSGTFVRC